MTSNSLQLFFFFKDILERFFFNLTNISKPDHNFIYVSIYIGYSFLNNVKVSIWKNYARFLIFLSDGFKVSIQRKY